MRQSLIIQNQINNNDDNNINQSRPGHGPVSIYIYVTINQGLSMCQSLLQHQDYKPPVGDCLHKTSKRENKDRPFRSYTPFLD